MDGTVGGSPGHHPNRLAVYTRSSSREIGHLALGRARRLWRTVAHQLSPHALAYFRPPAADRISKHDIDLFTRISDVLNDGALTFLADHDFRNDCHVSNLKPIGTISYWHGPNYMFNDPALQKRWEKLFASILHLSSTHGSNLTNS